MLFHVYLLIFKTYRFLLKGRHSVVKDIWFRNSLKLGYWSFGRSDIDVTILLAESEGEIIGEILETHETLKFFLPVMGEVNFFSESLMAPLTLTINPLELKKDPVLMETFRLDKRADELDKILFLHKFIMANWSNKERLSSRSPKLRFISRQVLDGGDYSFIDLLEKMAGLLELDNNLFVPEYTSFLKNHSGKLDPPVMPEVACLLFNKLCYLDLSYTLTPKTETLLERNVHWELWGCYSNQSRGDRVQMRRHMENMFTSLSSLLPKSRVDALKDVAGELGFRVRD